MPRETERKFLVTSDGWREYVTSTKSIRQAYLARTQNAQVRVRIVDGIEGTLNIKSAAPEKDRDEFEYAIPIEDAEELFGLAESGVVEKQRHALSSIAGYQWEIDEFGGRNQGLVLAELEGAHREENLALPDWCGDEVTGDPRYYNATLADG